MAVVINIADRRWSHPCDEFTRGVGKFCRRCSFTVHAHREPIECSSCGDRFARRDGEVNGLSHCDQHEDRRAL